MSVFYRINGEKIIVFGQTFPVKERLKALGARFDGANKTWVLTNNENVISGLEDICTLSPSIEADRPVKSDYRSASDDKPLDKPSLTDLTVGELMAKIQLAITSALPTPTWVVGEIHNIAHRQNGIFFALSEPRGHGSSIRTMEAKAIMWQNQYASVQKKRGDLSACMADGIKVRMLVQVGLYADRGAVSLTVLDVDSDYTKGALALAREKLLRELRQKGLDRHNKQLQLTRLPLVVGLITAPGSRAYSDFVDQLRVGRYPGRVFFVPVAMQGERTPSEVAQAVAALEQQKVDLIVITRGGGSAADLRWFDHEKVAYAIARSSIPIVAAIGHHDDRSVAEEIAFCLQKTPTAAADFVCQPIEQVRLRLNEVINLLREHGRSVVVSLRSDLHALLSTMRLHSRECIYNERLLARNLEVGLKAKATLVIGQWRSRLTAYLQKISSQAQSFVTKSSHQAIQAKQNLNFIIQQHLANTRAQLNGVEARLNIKDPRPWMSQGWTQLHSKIGPVLRAQDIQEGDVVNARLVDGSLQMTVDKLENFGGK